MSPMIHIAWTRERLQQLIDERLSGWKIIVVSNREPFIHRHNGNGIECIQPASGMASGLHPILMASGGTWVAHGSGDADREAADEAGRLAVPPDAPAYSLRRVWLSAEQEQGHYYGLSNEGLWPLCHITFTRPVFRPGDWATYREVNERFADAVLDEAGEQPAFVFIQDYHFCLLPRLLRDRSRGNLVIAQFWHIPWPNRETFRAFPWREELLDGLLGNDLLGFHLRYHCQNFMETVNRGLEAKVDRERWEITRGGRKTSVRAFPISIDFIQQEAIARSPITDDQLDRWRKQLPLDGHVIGAGIERLDYTKGIPDRFRALDFFFAEHPEWRGKLVFIQIAVPSRSQLPSYRGIEDEVTSLAGEVNRRWGCDGWQPIILIKKHHGPHEMAALHRLADFFIVNSLHDGMNLVAKEFVASRYDEQGILILSRFTGAQRELGDALDVNPFAIHETAGAIERALAMEPAEKQRRMRRMREQVAYNNIYRWGGKILSRLLQFDLPDHGYDDEITTLD